MTSTRTCFCLSSLFGLFNICILKNTQKWPKKPSAKHTYFTASQETIKYQNPSHMGDSLLQLRSNLKTNSKYPHTGVTSVEPQHGTNQTKLSSRSLCGYAGRKVMAVHAGKGQGGANRSREGSDWDALTRFSRASASRPSRRDPAASAPHGSQALPSCRHGGTPHHPHGVFSACSRCLPRLTWPWGASPPSSVQWHVGVAAPSAPPRCPRCHTDTPSASSPAQSGCGTAWLPAQ